MTDFVVLVMGEDDDVVPIIIGQPFSSNGGALVNIWDTKHSLTLGAKAITFGVYKSIKHSKNCDEYAFCVDSIDAWVENHVQEVIN